MLDVWWAVVESDGADADDNVRQHGIDYSITGGHS